jgi:hypothetical protein
MLTRYTELPVEQKMLVQQLNLLAAATPTPHYSPRKYRRPARARNVVETFGLRRRDLSGFPVVLTVQLGKLG